MAYYLWFSVNLRKQSSGKILSRLSFGLGRDRTHALSPTPSVAGTITSWSQRSPMVPPNGSGGERHSSQPNQGGGGSVRYKNDDPHLDHRLPFRLHGTVVILPHGRGLAFDSKRVLINLRGTFSTNPAPYALCRKATDTMQSTLPCALIIRDNRLTQPRLEMILSMPFPPPSSSGEGVI